MQQVYKLIGQVAPDQHDDSHHWRKRHGQGTRRARDFPERRSRNQAVYRHQLRGHSRKTCSRANCSATRKARLPARLAQRIGKFEQCDGGTIFLDEIGDMPMTTQTKILRVLQEGEISRVGNNLTIKIDVRIIAATNKDLWQAVQRKEFREDLVLSPQRRARATCRRCASARPIFPLLVAYFINKFRLKNPTGPSQIADEAMAAIQRSTWPGNVRELENCIQRAMVLASGNTITLANLPEEVSRGARSAAPAEIARPVFSSAAPAADAPQTSAPTGNPAPSGDLSKTTLANAIETLLPFRPQR